MGPFVGKVVGDFVGLFVGDAEGAPVVGALDGVAVDSIGEDEGEASGLAVGEPADVR